MGHVGATGTRAGALFIDLENFMVQTSRWSPPELAQTLTQLKMSIHSACNVDIQSMWATAQRTSRERLNSREHALKDAMASLGGKLVWCSKDRTADDSLIGKVEHQLSEGSLPPVVLILSDDGDFAPLMLKVRERRYAIAVGVRRMNSRLRQSAHKAFMLKELLQLRLRAPYQQLRT